MINLQPRMKIRYIISPRGYLIVESITSLEEILRRKALVKISTQELESISEEMQERGPNNA